jgi:hypothetical protein
MVRVSTYTKISFLAKSIELVVAEASDKFQNVYNLPHSNITSETFKFVSVTFPNVLSLIILGHGCIIQNGNTWFNYALIFRHLFQSFLKCRTVCHHNDKCAVVSNFALSLACTKSRICLIYIIYFLLDIHLHVYVVK